MEIDVLFKILDNDINVSLSAPFSRHRQVKNFLYFQDWIKTGWGQTTYASKRFGGYLGEFS